MNDGQSGKHEDACVIAFSSCICTRCQRDSIINPCCRKRKACPVMACPDYIEDKAPKKAASAE